MSIDLKTLEDRANKVTNDCVKKMLCIGLNSMRVFEEEVNSSNIHNMLSIRLLSDELPSGQIGLRQLTETLKSFESIQENGIASFIGFEGKRGRIPKDILERNELIITSTRAGSFIIDFGVKDYQISMFENENNMVINVMNDVSNLLDGTVDTLEVVATYSSSTFNSVKELVSRLNKEKLGIEIMDNINNLKKMFPKESISEINKKFKDTHIEKQESITVQGKLIKVDLSSQRITLDTQEGTIDIKVNDSEIKVLRLTTNEEYKIKTNVKVVIRRTQQSRTYVTGSVKNIEKA